MLPVQSLTPVWPSLVILCALMRGMWHLQVLTELAPFQRETAGHQMQARGYIRKLLDIFNVSCQSLSLSLPLFWLSLEPGPYSQVRKMLSLASCLATSFRS